jgi:hypothetical protein
MCRFLPLVRRVGCPYIPFCDLWCHIKQTTHNRQGYKAFGGLLVFRERCQVVLYLIEENTRNLNRKDNKGNYPVFFVFGTTVAAYFDYFDQDLPRDCCLPAILSVLICSQKELVVFHFSGSAVLPFVRWNSLLVCNPCPTPTQNDYWRIPPLLRFQLSLSGCTCQKIPRYWGITYAASKNKAHTPCNSILTDHMKTLSEDVSDLNGNIFTAAFKCTEPPWVNWNSSSTLAT